MSRQIYIYIYFNFETETRPPTWLYQAHHVCKLILPILRTNVQEGFVYAYKLCKRKSTPCDLQRSPNIHDTPSDDMYFVNRITFHYEISPVSEREQPKRKIENKKTNQNITFLRV